LIDIVHLWGSTPSLSSHAPLQYPVHRDALQQQTQLMVTAAGINQTPSAANVTASSGTDFAVHTSDEV
jgi:hypothetical protein